MRKKIQLDPYWTPQREVQDGRKPTEKGKTIKLIEENGPLCNLRMVKFVLNKTSKAQTNLKNINLYHYEVSLLGKFNR